MGANYDYATLKYDSNGTQQWVARYGGPRGGDDFARALALDSAGNVYITGESAGGSGASDYATVKYDASGNQLWVARYEGPGIFPGAITGGLVVDSVGNVYISLTASSPGSGSGYDYVTVKYDPKGNQQWVASYNGPINSDDYAEALAVDSAGNVYVTGESYGSDTTDYATVKYDPNGTQLWAARYYGPGNHNDGAVAVAVDSAGNVYVTGSSVGADGFPDYDYATVKYDLAGNQVWVARYNGPGNSVDFASTLMVDDKSNVYVTGESGSGFATLKYVQTNSAGLPTITNEPQSQIVVAGAAVTLTVGATGTPLLHYQWRFNGTNLLNATNSTLVLTNFQGSQAGDYSVIVSNPVGATISPEARLSLAMPPWITAAPNNRTVLAGGDVSFKVLAIGNPAPNYQWRHNGQDISGATNSTLFLTNVQPSQAGDYSVEVRNAYGTNSATAHMTVVPLTIEVQPQSQAVIAGDSAVFTVQASSYSPTSYQWQHNSGDIANATNSTLALMSVQFCDAGDYSVIVANSYGSVTSTVARLTIAPLIVITQPKSESVFVGQDVTFTVQANGRSAPNYQWNFNGTRISGATSSTLTLTNVQITDAGDYSAIVANSSASVTSAVARLSVRLAGPLDLWSLRRGTGTSLRGITFGNGICVAVGDSGAILTSADGVTWTNQSVATASFLRGVAYANGAFVAVGNEVNFDTQCNCYPPHGIILGSMDGVSWHDRFRAASNTLDGITYGNGLFVAVGGGIILTSPDGVDWTPQTSAISLGGVAYGGSLFVAVGSGIMTSDDGITWTNRNLAVFASAVAYGNGLFAAAGGTGHNGLIATSSDGADWRILQFGGADYFLGVTYGNGTFVAVGYDDNPNIGAIFTSQDGTNWMSRDSGTTSFLYAIAYGNGRFVAVGDGGAVVLSEDGSTWRSLDNLHSITSGNGILAVVGARGTILTSTDGVTWNDRTGGNTTGLDEIIFANNMFIAVGNAGAVLTSADGVTWASHASGTANELHGITHDNGLFVAVGRNGTILTSTDGISWTSRSSGTTSYLKSVTYGSGTFVAVGNLSSNVLTSTDGVTWASRDLPVPYSLNFDAIVYANGTFVAVGDAGYVATSSDGITWSVSSTSTYLNLRAVTYANGTFVVVANNGVILTSSDAVTWASRASATGNNLRDVVYFDGRFVAVGNNGTVLQSGSFAPAQLRAHGRPSRDGFELVITGEIGRTYRVQASSDLSRSNWVDLFTFENTDGTTTVFLDSQAGHFAHRFYRVVSP